MTKKFGLENPASERFGITLFRLQSCGANWKRVCKFTSYDKIAVVRVSTNLFEDAGHSPRPRAVTLPAKRSQSNSFVVELKDIKWNQKQQFGNKHIHRIRKTIDWTH